MPGPSSVTEIGGVSVAVLAVVMVISVPCGVCLIALSIRIRMICIVLARSA